MYEEPTFLLEKEVRELVSYFSIIKTIATGQHKLSQIGATLGLPSSSVTPYLKLLMDLEIVEKRVPVTEDFPEKSRKGLYFIKDHFIHFWFKFVFPYKGELEMDNVSYVLGKIRQQFVENHVSFVYEEICRSLFIQLCKTGDIEFNAKCVGAYWNNHCEIDLMALNEAEKQVFVGECKYKNKPVDADVLFELMKKAENITELKGYHIQYILFSKSGFTKRLMDQAKDQGSIVLVNEDKKL